MFEIKFMEKLFLKGLVINDSTICNPWRFQNIMGSLEFKCFQNNGHSDNSIFWTFVFKYLNILRVII